MRIQDAKTVYAQSSDIKARTYLQYRFDMKRKAIAELEAKDWIAEKIREAFQATRVHLVKSGGDAFLWFLRGGGVTREPDYRATIERPTGSRSLDVEFQYADKSGLEFYDFKLSKVRRKRKGTVEPRETLFVYIHKPLRKYALLEAAWIMEHGRIGPVPAWGSRQAYRVPAAIFEAQLRPDPALPGLIARIDAKNQLLSYQHTQLEHWRQTLQRELEGVIDEKRMLTWHPERLDTFFKVVFALEHLNRTPTNAPLWLVYAASYVATLTNLEQAAQVAYILDALYGRIPVGELRPNEQQAFLEGLKAVRAFVLEHRRSDGSFLSSPQYSPCDETRFALFAINLLEDMVQDFWFYYRPAPEIMAPLRPIARIYEWLPDVPQSAAFVRACLASHNS